MKSSSSPIGYAVLQMNPRLAGLWPQIPKAPFKQWGSAMQDDITDGVNWLIKRRHCRPGRIAIYGAISYGGYATLDGRYQNV